MEDRTPAKVTEEPRRWEESVESAGFLEQQGALEGQARDPRRAAWTAGRHRQVWQGGVLGNQGVCGCTGEVG